MIELAAWVQHGLTSIHPFVNGNGRVARLMTNVILRRFGFTLRGTFCGSSGCNVNVPVAQDNVLGTWSTSNGLLDGYQWEKLYDRVTCNPPEVCNRDVTH